MSDAQQTDTSFMTLVPEAWLMEPDIKGAVIRGYTSGIAEFAENHQKSLAAVRSFLPLSDGRFVIGFGEIPRSEPQQIFQEIVTFHGDEIRMNIDVRQGTIPPGYYVFLALPTYDNSEAYVTRRTESIRGLLTLVAGHTAMLDLAFEQRFDFSQPDKISRVSRVVESHIHPRMWEVFAEDTLQKAEVALISSTGDIKARAELAFSFISRSTNNLDQVARYANTWIALEIAAGGHKAVKTFLNGLDPAFGSEAKRFFDLRNALFHHGKRPEFDQADERFLCACVLAILLGELGITDPAFEDLVQAHLCERAKVT
ncbi:hypothetical protein [Sphingomonas sp. OK281]|uniref:hypothetical protein n=1 Tax=Sphingomonas sp. OK281 TaxID=1881067 RepID=UPI0008F1AE22|nr:hypothetical protein [Sphingomonas sp. OK281]SFO18924.1 hypothetical protein SAMN05428984_2624 [Sphingomonas sp. OK281]